MKLIDDISLFWWFQIGPITSSYIFNPKNEQDFKYLDLEIQLK
jgi:hypothetical protein